MNTRSILTSTAALVTLALAACSAPESDTAAEPAPEPSATAEPGTGASDQSSAVELHRTDSAPAQDSEPTPEPTPTPTPDSYETYGPRFALDIEDPDAEPCPYGAEVAQVEGHVEQFNRALELGCYMDIYGVIEFTEPVVTNQWNEKTDRFVDHSSALTPDELCDEGYISAEECEADDRWW
ncbi:hypothetical protein [Nesterenkonia haasae]|uniref:hypothetical protein n=1 Tax=Nesterenkonia haasae TaxID=2587813 RepID=UPI001390FBF1|nr:hypothetical protein [Nesterenkonia haasae]NDK31275.1 hypothetical protein [Nesterenkonia haasae]